MAYDYIDPRGRRSGPFTEAELKDLARRGLIERDGALRLAGIDRDLPIDEVRWLVEQFDAPPSAARPPAPPDAPEPPATVAVDAPPALASTPLPAPEPAPAASASVPLDRSPSAPPKSADDAALRAAARAAREAALATPAVSRAAFVLLAILPGFAGIFGIHNVLAGYTARGVVQLALSITTIGGCCVGGGFPPCLCIGIPMWLALFAWSTIEAIAVNRDARGVPMR